MASHFQAAPLVASPSYPNSVSWSEENLVAVASGHLITILNPALLVGGPRGLIMLPQNKPFPIGVVKREDLCTPCLMPTCLSRNTRPCARSISWSHPGLAPNSGCLLAVCNTEGRVKLYRSPYCEFAAEWIEVTDISDRLYAYFLSTNFGKTNVPSTKFCQEQTSEGCFITLDSAIELPFSISIKGCKSIKLKASCRINEDVCHGTKGGIATTMTDDRLNNTAEATPSQTSISKQSSLAEAMEIKSTNFMENNLQQSSLEIKSQREPPNKRAKNGGSSEIKSQGVRPSRRTINEGLPQTTEGLPLITADQYASRSALLSSLIVAWSPTLHSSSRIGPANCAILAVGGKSGNISFWRIHEPQSYTIEDGRVPIDAMLVGLIQAHNAWITAISWGMYAIDASRSQLVLATGSSDGSAKIWLGDVEGLIKSSEVNSASFFLLKEVIAVTSVPISVISIVVPVKYLDKVLIAIGKGSGCLEAWICYMSTNKFLNAGIYNAHDQVVTGLAWAFDGGCLYSCSQDGSVRSWIFYENSLCESTFPPNSPGHKVSKNVTQVSDPCFGLALSPGNLVVSVARSFDANLLNPMYQAKTQKAAVDFFWIGGQPLEISSDKKLDCRIEDFLGLSKRELVCWEVNILWSLKQYDSVDKKLVLWDVLAALLAFKQSEPSFVEHILIKWISSWFSGFRSDVSMQNILFDALSSLTKFNARQMHLLNIISRRLILTGINEEEHVQQNLWNELLVKSERELQERLVAFTFKAALSLASCWTPVLPSGRYWLPVGVAQMEQWVLINQELVQDQVKLLGSKIRELGSRLHSISEYEIEENCSFCSASVPFESAEVACCKGPKCADRSNRRHKLIRCAVSMQLCPITAPLWFCVCCQRWVYRLASQTFFTMSSSPLDASYVNESFTMLEHSKPLCPFCGILLKRSLPEFLLSASPV